jgi:hypothetical protein
MADETEVEKQKDSHDPNKKGPKHDWVVTSVDEEVEYSAEKTDDGRTRRVRHRQTKTKYKEDTGVVTRHCCVIS